MSMTKRFESRNSAVFAAWAKALLAATEQTSGFVKQLTNAAEACKHAAFQLNQLSLVAGRLSSLSQAAATYGCYDCQASDERESLKLSFSEEVSDRITTFSRIATMLQLAWLLGRRLPGTRAFAALGSGITSAARTAAAALLFIWATIRSVVQTIESAIVVSLFDQVLRPLGQAALGRFELIIPPIFGTRLAGPGIAMIGYAVWRYKEAIARVIRILTSVLTMTLKELSHNLADVGQWIGDKCYQLTNPIETPNGYSAAAFGARTRREAFLAAWERAHPQRGLLLSGMRVNAAAAILATPLLITPAGVQPTSIQPQYEGAKTASIVINSSPTIAITAADCQAIEQRVLAALKEHREALFDQWCNELQRRQRTEL